MDAHTERTSPAELASEVGGLLTGLGVLSVMLVPFAVPLLALTALLALPLVVIAIPVGLIWLLARGAKRLLTIARPRERAERPTGRPEHRHATAWTGTP